MAQNEPQRKETPPGPSPNSPSLLFENTLNISVEAANLSDWQIESNRSFFCPNWNALEHIP